MCSDFVGAGILANLYPLAHMLLPLIQSGEVDSVEKASLKKATMPRRQRFEALGHVNAIYAMTE